MRTIVLDTNCLLAILPSVSPYHNVWTGILKGDICLCVSTDILSEYEEILSVKTLPEIAVSVIETLLRLPSLRRVSPTFFYNLIIVTLGNIVGGAVFVAVPYYIAGRRD